MMPSALTYYFVLSLILNLTLFLCYRRERDRRSLMCVCLDLPRTSDWWSLYYRGNFIMTKVAKMEDN